MRTRYVIAPIVVIGLVLAGCSGFKVNSDYNPEIDFTQYGTFAWLPHANAVESAQAAPVDGLLAQRIERAVDEALSAKGMRRVENEADASLLVTDHISVEQKLRVNTTNYGYGYGYWGYYGGGYTDTYVDQYEEGTLMLDFIDAESRQLVWRGTVQSRLRTLDTPAQREKHVRNAVNAILERYPPKTR